MLHCTRCLQAVEMTKMLFPYSDSARAVFSQCLSTFADMGLFVNGNDILNHKLLANMLDRRI